MPCAFLDLSRADFARGYGGRYGVESDRVDKSAAGADYQAPKVRAARACSARSSYDPHCNER